MARARSTAWLAIPMILAVGAVAWLVLSSSHGSPAGGSDGDGSAREADAAPEEATAPTGGTLAKGDPSLVKKPGKGDDAESTPVFPKSEGVFGRLLDSHETPIPSGKVALWPVDPSKPWGQVEGPPAATAASGPDGRFLVGPAPAGRLRIRGDAPGYAGTVVYAASKGACVDLILDKGGSLKVRVKDPAGSAVAGAEVRVTSGTVVTTAATNAAGEALVDALPTGQAALRVTATGFAPINVNDVVIEAGKTLERACFVGKGVAVTGRVVEEPSGAAVPGAEVTAKGQWDPSAQVAAPVKTDAEGRFTIECAGAANDWMQIGATKEGYGAASSGIRLQQMGSGGGQEVILKMSRGGDARAAIGVVVDADGRPVAGATVLFPNMPRGVGNSTAPTATTDAEGRFSLELPTGTGKDWNQMIAATAKGMGVGAGQASSAKPAGPTIRLSGAGIVTGRVTSPAGEALEGANVTLTYDWNARAAAPPPPSAPSGEVQPWMLQQLYGDARLAGVLAASTDASGAFRIEGVPAATYRVEAAWGLDRATAPESVTIRPGGTETATVSMGAGKTIEGRVLDTAGSPIPGAFVNGWDPQNTNPRENRSGAARADSDGVFKLRNTLGDRWQLTVFATGYAAKTVQNVSVGEKAVEVKLMSLGWIDGVVLADGAPYAGSFGVSAQFAGEIGGAGSERGIARVRSFTPTGGGNMMSYDGGNNGREESFTSADGRFRLRGVASGPWKVNVTTPDGWIPTAPVEVAVSDGQGAGPVEIRLVRGASIEGVLREDGAPSPVANAQVSLRIKGAAETGGLSSAWSTTDARGRYAASGLAGGTYVLSVTTREGLSVEEEIRLSAGQTMQHDLTALRFGSILVKVVDRDGRPVANAQVNLTTERGTWVQPNWDLLRKENRIDLSGGKGWQKVTQTDENGLNQRWHVPPGRISVQAKVPSLSSSSDTVLADVASDRNTEVTLTVQGSADAGPGK